MKRKSEELEKDDELKISQKPFLRPTFPEGPPTKKEKYQIYEWSSSNLSAIAKENQIVLNLFGEVLQEYKEDFAEEDLTQVYELEKAVLQEFEDYVTFEKIIYFICFNSN